MVATSSTSRTRCPGSTDAASPHGLKAPATLAWRALRLRRVCDVVPRRRRNTALPNEGHEIVASPVLRDLGRDIARKLGLSWLVDCDVMFDETGAPCLLEVNPRPSHSLVVAMAAGAPLLDDMIALARGLPLAEGADPSPALVVPYRTMAAT